MARSKLKAAVALLAVAALCVLVHLRYQREIGPARARIATGSTVVDTPCGAIEYAVDGDGPAVLVVHGAGGGHDQGMDISKAFVPRGFRVIAMSRFGYLRTPLPADASAAAQADAHACLLDALDIPRAAVIGVSAGAPSSMQLALRHPERTAALVLLVPAAYVPRPGSAPPMRTPAGTDFLFETALKSDFVFWAGIRLARPTMIRAILATPPEVVAGASADEQASVAQTLDHILPVSPRRLGLLNDAAVTSSLPRYELERIAVPTLAISAADDLYGTFDGARYSAAHIPRARFIGYPNGGHLLVGHQQEVAAEIAALLQ
ncbi:alpha/beta fold hydrolase [Lysobacter koreensis]|uniref:Alpha/beta fold hydrolase n=1 Tax=Lysobacter koreensis TaxID=266122 RepID=A0ABW2YHM1_9GAMM